jgi:hypothetical protein
MFFIIFLSPHRGTGLVYDIGGIRMLIEGLLVCVLSAMHVGSNEMTIELM